MLIERATRLHEEEREEPSGKATIASCNGGPSMLKMYVRRWSTGVCSSAKKPPKMINQMRQSLSYLRTSSVSIYLTTDTP